MTHLDWVVVGVYFALMLGVGLHFGRRAGRSVADYFVSGRDMPWWIIGLSAVATYSDAGLAPAVTMLTFQGGLLGNGIWWIPYVIWMPLGAVLWSKYWRRLGTVTSAELLNVRYSGRVARGYRAVYAIFMSFGFIVVLMGYVSGWLGAALGPILGWQPIYLILFAGAVTVIYTTTSGLSGAAYTDAFQFSIFLAGNIILVPIVLSRVGGLEHVHQLIALNRNSTDFFRVIPPVPGLGPLTMMALAVQGLFFAASPTGGEGFTAQRFMAARNEFHAQIGQLANTVLTLIVRVVPFLFMGMIAAALFRPAAVGEAGELWATLVRNYAPKGLMGLLVAGIFAAYMGTISTEMNWGASYLVNDLYRPFLRPNQSERHYVFAGRVGSVLLFAMSILVAYFFVQGLRAWLLFINSMVFAFVLPLSWLRFFWWRLNIYGEMTALVLGLPLSYLVWFPLGFHDERVHPFWHGFLLLFGVGALVIVLVTYLFRPESEETLLKFYLRCRPAGLWGPVARQAPVEVRKAIHEETLADLADCGLGVVFAAAAILFVISLLGGHYLIVTGAAVTAVISCTWFVLRWTRKGAFRELGASEVPETVSYEA